MIGEGSYGRVYHGVLKSGRAAAIKKLDSSKQPDREFSAQVRSFGLSYFELFYIIHKPLTLLGYDVTISGFHGIKTKT